MGFVQGKRASGSGDTITVTLDATPTAGNVLVVTAAKTNGSTPHSPPASGQGGVTTWVEATRSVVNLALITWYGVVDGTPDPNINISNGYAVGFVYAEEVSGLDNANLLHGTPLNSGGLSAGSPVGPPSFTPTNGAKVYLVAAAVGNDLFTSDAAAPFTSRVGNADNIAVADDDVASASGSYTTSWSIPIYNTYETLIFALKQASGSGQSVTAAPIRGTPGRVPTAITLSVSVYVSYTTDFVGRVKSASLTLTGTAHLVTSVIRGDPGRVKGANLTSFGNVFNHISAGKIRGVPGLLPGVTVRLIVVPSGSGTGITLRIKKSQIF